MYPKTIICDLDGVVVKHTGSMHNIIQHAQTTSLLPGAKEMFEEWNTHSCYIILVTGRKESARKLTEQQLQQHGLFWDQLIMGVPRGERVVINDKKPDGQDTARAINLARNKGLYDLNMQWEDQ